MATLLLDSSVIFDHLNGRHGRTEFLAELIRKGHVLGCCAINVAEVHAGMRPGEEQRTERFLSSLEYLEITRPVAELAGRLRREWMRKGRTLGLSDLLIAAVAIHCDIPLVTENGKDFPMAELRLFPLDPHP